MPYIGSLQGGGSTTGSTSALFNPGSGISGLASGINTSAMVKGLMGAAQVPLVQLLQQRQDLQWKETRYQQVNASLSTLQNSVQSMQLQSTFLANSAQSSNPSVVSATASPLTPQGTYNVSVQKLAQGATLASASPISTTDANYPSDTTLSSLGYSSGVNLKINGQSFSFQGTDTLQSVLNEINSNASAGVSGFYDSNSNNFSFQTAGTGSKSMINVDSTTASFFNTAFNINAAPSITGTVDLSSGISSTSPARVVINGQKMQLSGTLSNIVSTINSYQSTTGVTASTTTNGSGAQYLTLNSSSTGSSGSSNQLLSLISVSDPSNALGLQSPYSGNAAQQVAQDAQFTVNGMAESSSTNQATFNGLSLDLQSTSSSSTQVTVSPDVNGITKSITDFVKQYNQTLQLMQGLYNEKRQNSYQPLTSSQASQMTQNQIDQWNQKAQAGMLENDPTIGGTMSTLENDMQNFVSGQPSSTVNGQSTTLNSMASIGITPIDPLTGPSSGAQAPGVTTSGWNTYGLLQVDPTKLKAAIQADPQAVMRLFTNNPALSGSATGVGTGIAVQLNQDLTTATKTLTQQAGSNPNVSSLIQSTTASGATVPGAGLMQSSPIDPNANFSSLFSSDTLDTSFMGQQLNSLDSQATSMQKQLDSLQKRYQAEFSQMEQAMSQLNNQSGGLTAMMGGGGSSTSSSSGG